MADPKTEQRDDFQKTLDTGQAMGQNADGTFDTFPASELAQKTAERDSNEAATQYAMEQSEEGYPGPKPGDVAGEMLDMLDSADQDPV